MDTFYSPKIIAILFNQKSNDAESLASEIKLKLKDDFEVFSQSTESALNNGLNNKNIDLIISIGGDGNVLRCAHVLNGSNCPILGINLGRLGFLCEIDSSDLDRKLISYLGGEAVIEKRSILKIHLFKDNSKKEFFALNDFVIARGSKVRIIDVEASLNGNHFATYRGDGVVVSTATGSTAYSLSLGGAILSPSSNNMIIKPIASHTSLLGGLVMESDATLILKADSREDLSLTVDGFIDTQLREFDYIEIQVDDSKTVNFVRGLDFRSDYWNSLAKKLELRKGESLGR